MAFEYSASAKNLNSLPLEVIAAELVRQGLCIAETVSPNEARFRWVGSEYRDSWPEDFELSRHERLLLLIVHSGTRQQREGLVEALGTILSRFLAEAVTFEEA